MKNLIKYLKFTITLIGSIALLSACGGEVDTKPGPKAEVYATDAPSRTGGSITVNREAMFNASQQALIVGIETGQLGPGHGVASIRATGTATVCPPIVGKSIASYNPCTYVPAKSEPPSIDGKHLVVVDARGTPMPAVNKMTDAQKAAAFDHLASLQEHAQDQAEEGGYPAAKTTLLKISAIATSIACPLNDYGYTRVSTNPCSYDAVPTPQPSNVAYVKADQKPAPVATSGQSQGIAFDIDPSSGWQELTIDFKPGVTYLLKASENTKFTTTYGYGNLGSEGDGNICHIFCPGNGYRSMSLVGKFETGEVFYIGDKTVKLTEMAGHKVYLRLNTSDWSLSHVKGKIQVTIHIN